MSLCHDRCIWLTAFFSYFFCQCFVDSYILAPPSVAIGKAPPACPQSFALWQQATIEIMCHNYSPRTLVVMLNRSQVNIVRASMPRSLYYSLFAPRIHIVVLCAHPVRGESHIQLNVTGEVATPPLVMKTSQC